MSPSDQQFSQKLHKYSHSAPSFAAVKSRYTALLLLLPSLLIGACRSPEQVPLSESGQCGEDGRLTSDLFGAMEVSLDWQADVLECNGMPRPNSEGARLHFAGPAQSGSAKRSLTFILAMPGLRRGEVAEGLPTNVTMIEEGAGRFFATGHAENCWTDVQQHDQVGSPDDSEYKVSGILYCVAPLAELKGNASISFAEINFTGRVNWEIPK